MKIKKVLIRYKWCKTAVIFYLILFVFAFLTFAEPRFYPLFIFFLVDFLLVVSAAFYLVIEEKDV